MNLLSLMQARRGLSSALCAFVLACLGLPQSAHAHDPGLSTASIQLQRERIKIVLALSLDDVERLTRIDEDRDGSVSRAEFTRGQARLDALAAKEFSLALDHRRVMPTRVQSRFTDQNGVEIELGVVGRAVSTLSVTSRLVSRLGPGLHQLVTLSRENGLPIAERLLDAHHNFVTIDIRPPADAQAPTPKTTGFADFLVLGVEHILTGYDHLLFIFALLVVTSRLSNAIQIITCFTIAHSLTLAVATFSVVQIPSRVAEPLIAASIVYVGIENLVRGDDPKGRWLLTFAFGLIHGFGFASVLRELGVGANGAGIAMPLLSFNLGVELGQVIVAALALPVIWKLRTHRGFVARWVPACSMAVALLGGYWFVQRVWF